jgi:UDP-N-acetylmuramoyl-tripeptide--D-alanyl-D-alanine ligase
LFVAFAGEKTDGHEYVRDAFARGAVAAMVEQPIASQVGDKWATIDMRQSDVQAQMAQANGRPLCLLVGNTLQALQSAACSWRARFPIRVIAITGSVGKTSTKELTYAVLSRRFRTLKSEGNQNNEIGLPLTLLNIRPHHQRIVVEMGMYAKGEIGLLCSLAMPQIGVITMIGPAHLERLGTMEAIVEAKRELIEALPADGVAILNKDDARVMDMAGHTQARIFTYGLDRRADLSASNIHSMGLDGVRFTLHHRRTSLSVRVPLIGRHNVHTALRAAAVGLAENMSWEEIVAGLSSNTAQLRLVAVPGPNNSMMIDDTYNSSPDSALAALNLLQDLDGRRVAVLGDMLELGPVEEEAHRLVGRRAADVADVLVAVGPRGRMIGQEALAVGMPRDQVFLIDDTPRAIPVLEEVIKAGDFVLVKGSLGMAMSQIVTALGRKS